MLAKSFRARFNAAAPAPVTLKQRLARPPRSGVASPTADCAQALFCQAVQRGVHRTNSRIPPRAQCNFLPYAHPVSVPAQPQHRQQNQLFELADGLAFGHNLYRTR